MGKANGGGGQLEATVISASRKARGGTDRLSRTREVSDGPVRCCLLLVASNRPPVGVSSLEFVARSSSMRCIVTNNVGNRS